jgi:hypothetical protein
MQRGAAETQSSYRRKNLFLQKETKVTKVFAAAQEYGLCSLRYLLFKLLSPQLRNSLQKETKIAKIFKNQRLRPLLQRGAAETQSSYRRKRSQGRACIPTERKFKLRFPPPEFFTEGNEGKKGRSGPAKYNLCFLRYLLFKIFSDAENLFLQKETKVRKVL